MTKPANQHVPGDYLLDSTSEQAGGDPAVLAEVLAAPGPTGDAAAGTEADFFDRPISP
jgi:hypothetical protein